MQPTLFSHVYYDSMMGGGYYGDGTGWIGALLMLLFWAALIGLFVVLIRSFMHDQRSAAGHRDPHDIARERYAKGEITKDELSDIVKTLRQR